MGRTKFATTLVQTTDKKVKKIRVRMPDGEFYETAGKKYGEVWLARVPVTYGIPKEKPGGLFETGLVKGQCGFYIRERKMWLFRRSAGCLSDIDTLFFNYIKVFFGGSMDTFRRCMEKVKAEENRKGAKKCLDFHYWKYGVWQYGRMGGVTRTRGYKELVARKEEFSNYYEKGVRITDGEPTIAWQETF